MPSVRSILLATAATFVGIASADYTIDPDSVPLSTRQQWCTSEIDTCPIICQQSEPGTTLVNDCDPDTLTYGCLCGNNQRPNISEYSLTLPYFVCTEWGNQCVTNCGGDAACASACRQDNPCGAQDPVRVNKTSTTSGVSEPTASSSGDGTTIFTGAPGEDDENSSGSSSSSSSSSDKGSGAVSALDIGRSYGLTIVLGTMFAAFALI